MPRARGRGAGNTCCAGRLAQRLMIKQLYATDARRAAVDTFQRTSRQMVRVRELDNDATAAKVRTRASLPRTNARAQLRFCGELVRLQPECEVLLVGRGHTAARDEEMSEGTRDNDSSPEDEEGEE